MIMKLIKFNPIQAFIF